MQGEGQPEFRDGYGKTFGLLRGDSTCWYICGHYTDQARKDLYFYHPWARTGGDVGSNFHGLMDYFKSSVQRDAAVFNTLVKTRKNELNLFRTELKEISDLHAIVAANQRPKV